MIRSHVRPEASPPSFIWSLVRPAFALCVVAACLIPHPAATEPPYLGMIETKAGAAGQGRVATGSVFEDLSRDGRRQSDEPGISGVLVSNGTEVVRTDAAGRYTLPVYEDMTVMVIKPAGYRTPVNDDLIPQFAYAHKPGGTPGSFRYGGLPPTGPLPAEINFPLVRGSQEDSFSCVVMGDTQPYSNNEVGYIRDSILETLLDRDLADSPCMILLGDVMGDDLGLLPRFMNMMSAAGLPQYYVHGNHDYDFDATSDADSADSWRRLYGPNYFAFEIGQALLVALDNVVYPCTEADATGHAVAGDRARCGQQPPVYNGRVDDRQMQWLGNLLAEVPKDRLVVLMHHIPLVSFIDSATGRHQTDNAQDLYTLLRGRPALSLSGHTHTYEYLSAGEWFGQWEEMVGVRRLPFDHVIGGAPSGNWFSGDFGFDGVPLAFGRGGTPPGLMMIRFDGNRFRVEYQAANQPPSRQMGLAFNTPQFRTWFRTLAEWQSGTPSGGSDAIPPVTVNDLADLKLFTPQDLADGVYLTANVWNGERNTRVFAEIAGGPRVPMERTQSGDGEAVRAGPEFADPFSIPRQMTIGRFAWRSSSGDERAQGFELWQGKAHGPASPQAVGAWLLADSSPHLWRLRMPANLPTGTHVATVTAIDRHGTAFVERIAFEVRAERPPRYWRRELWQ